MHVLREVGGGATIVSVARSHGITEQTVYRWRAKYGQVGPSEVKARRDLESENQRLKRLIDRQAVEIDAYKEVAEGKW